jgi:hypothetical protein
VKQVIEGALVNVNRPALSALFAAKYKMRSAAMVLAADRG